MILLHLYISVVGMFLTNLVEIDRGAFSLAIDTAVYLGKHIVRHFFDLREPKNGNFLKILNSTITYFLYAMIV